MPNSGVDDLENELKERVTSEYLEAKGIMKDARKYVKVGDFCVVIESIVAFPKLRLKL